MKKITIGADPELFLINENGVGIPSEEYFVGTKDNPTDLGGGYQLLCDNVMVEYNIPACNTEQEFVDANNTMLNYINNSIPEYVHIDLVSSKTFIAEKLRSKIASQFGCSADYNAWLLEVNPKPKAKNNKLRTAAGHIHIGYPEISHDKSWYYIKLLDYFLALPSLLIDEDTKRREMYGKAGCFRLSHFGFEYRTLGNFWLRSDELMRWVYTTTVDVMNMEFDTFDFSDSDLVIKAINNSDVELAKTLMEKYKINEFNSSVWIS
jgi:hypothetical protein